jgi:hypothetical protein
LRRRAPLLLVLLAVGAVCLLLFETLFATDVGAGTDDGAGDLLDAGLLGIDGTANPAGAPTLAGLSPEARAEYEARRLAAEAAARAAAEAAGGNPAHVPFEGRVLGTDGRPASGVKIKLVSSRAVTLLETDADGAFSQAIAPGRYKILFDGGEAGALLLRTYMIDGAPKENLEFALREHGEVAVYVTRGSEAVAGATVTVASRDLGDLVRSELTTDGDGLALFEQLPHGRYEVAVQVPDGPRVTHDTWAPSGSRRAVKVRVPEGTILRGTVRAGGPQGPGVAGARITLQSSARRSHGVFETVFETGPDGRYEVMVPRGNARSFTVQADGWAPWPTDRERRRVLRSLRGLAGKQPVARDVVLASGGGVSGVVRTSEKQPIAGVTLRFQPPRGPHASATTGEDGTYHLAQLNPDRYEVKVETPGWFPDRDQKLRVAVPKERLTAPVPFDITLDGARRLAGIVTLEEGEPAVGAHVRVIGGGRVVTTARQAGRTLETFTDAKGHWVISDVPVDRTVIVRITMGLLEADPLWVRWEQPPPNPLRSQLAGTGTLNGTVIDIASRTGLRGARVTLRPDPYDGRTALRARTNVRGEWTIRGILPGSWTATPDRSGYLEAQAEGVEVQRGGETPMTLMLDPGEIFAGTVVDERGAPVPWARVRVRGTPVGKEKPVQRAGNANARGVFRLTGLARGTYVVTVSRRGYRTSKSGPIRGGDERLVVTLRRRG